MIDLPLCYDSEEALMARVRGDRDHTLSALRVRYNGDQPHAPYDERRGQRAVPGSNRCGPRFIYRFLPKRLDYLSAVERTNASSSSMNVSGATPLSASFAILSSRR